MQIEINSENAEGVINNLTMNVELADKGDQIAINFAVITDVMCHRHRLGSLLSFLFNNKSMYDITARELAHVIIPYSRLL